MKKLFLPTLLLVVLVVSLLSTAIIPHASAVITQPGGTSQDPQDATYSWINEGEIQMTIAGSSPETFIDTCSIQEHDQVNSSPSTYCPYNSTSSDACAGQSSILADTGSPNTMTQGGVIYYQAAANGNCQSWTIPSGITLMNPGNADIVYVKSGTTISRIDGNDEYTFNQTSNPDIYTDTNSSHQGSDTACSDTIIDDNGTWKLYELDSSSDGYGAAPSDINAPDCYISNQVDDMDGPAGTGTVDSCTDPITQNASTCSDWTQNKDGSFTLDLGTVANATAGSAAAGGGSTVGDDTGPTINCHVSIFNPVSWFLCPIAAGLQALAEGLDNSINSALTVGTQNWGKEYYQAWSAIRDIALGLIVIAGLLAIISQASGVEIFDAYTIRKALPRILIVAIGISVSWPVIIWFVGVTNDLGNGIRYLIYLGAGGKNIYIDGGGQAVIGLVAGVAGASLGIVGLLSFAATAALAASVAFLVLVLRQMIIIALVIFSPIALACYVLPHTQRVWKLWWDSFSKGLLMFPLIAGIIAIGRVFASVTSANQDAVWQAMAFVAYFAPYFLIPFTFRLAGGAIANIGGFVNDRHRGAFDGLKNFRANQSKTRRANAQERMTTGNTFKRAPEGSLRSRLNRGIEGTTKVGQAGFDPRHWRTNMQTAMADSADSHVGKFAESAEAAAIFGDDPQVWAARFNRREDIARELENKDAKRFAGSKNRADRDKAVSRIMRAQRTVGNEVFQRARVRAQAKTGTGYRNKKGEFDAAMMMADINEVYKDDRNGANRALAEMRGSLSQSGQIAGQAGFGKWSQQMERLRNGEVTAKYAHEAVMDDAADSVPPSQALYGKPDSARAIGAAHARKLQKIINNTYKPKTAIKAQQAGMTVEQYTESQFSAAMASAAGIYDAMAQASPQNASAMANELMGIKIKDGPALPGMTTQVPKMRANGQPMVDEQGHAMYDTVVSAGKLSGDVSVREYIQSQMQQNPEFVNRRRDFSQATYAQAQQQQAAAQAAGGGGMPPGGGNLGMPGGGLPG